MNNRIKFLILTGSSFIGSHIHKHLGTEKVVVTYNRRPIETGLHFDALKMDISDIITDPKSISHAIILLGDTSPESCVADINRSQALNVKSIQRILLQLKKWSIKPVFTSTEVVFDGKKGAYIESDSVNPILTYARQKVEVESFIKELFEDYLIIRLALVYGSCFGDGTILSGWAEAVENGAPISCATDYICSPIHVEDAASSVLSLIQLNCKGIYHLAGTEHFSRCNLLDMLLEEMGSHSIEIPPIRRCSINEFNVAEFRPLDVSMNPEKVIRDTGIVPRKIEDACREMLGKQFGYATVA